MQSEREIEKFIRDITRREACKTDDALGFIPLAGIMENYRKGNVKVLRENGDIVGYIYISPVAPVRRVFQLAVREDARRIELATKLLRQSLGDTPATLRCAADIPGALFWRAVGFNEVKRERPASRRKREIITFARGNTTPLF